MIGAAMEWRWGSEGEDGKEESGDEEEGSKKIQEEETLSSTSC